MCVGPCTLPHSVANATLLRLSPTFSGKRYFATFIDEYSHLCVVILLKSKSEVATKFAEFVAWAETQTGKRVKTL